MEKLNSKYERCAATLKSGESSSGKVGKLCYGIGLKKVAVKVGKILILKTEIDYVPLQIILYLFQFDHTL